MIILNTPHNPIGKVFNRQELERIAELCRKWNVLCVSDEVYEWLVFDGAEHIRICTLPGMWDRTITLGSAGKTFSVTGWKIGWAYGPAPLIRNLQMVHQNSVSTCPTPLQEGVARSFEVELARLGQPESYFLSLPRELKEKRDFMAKFLSEAGMRPTIPEGGYFMLADWSPLTDKVDLSSEPDNLGDNGLSDLNFEVRCLNNLRFLDLERNKFTFVKPTDLRVLNELEERPNRTANLIVDFNLNPFVCDCRIAPFRTWIPSTQVTVRNKDSLTCTHTSGKSAAHLLQMDMGQCADAMAAAATILNTAEEEQRYGGAEAASIQSEAHISGHTATLIFLLIVLSMILLGLLVALVYVSRDKLKYMITPVFDNVAKKVQYTSIKDEDCPEVHV